MYSGYIMIIGMVIGMIPLTIGFFILNDIKLGLMLFIIGYCTTLPFSMKARHKEIQKKERINNG